MSYKNFKSFKNWLKLQTERNDPVGDLARDAFSDVNWDGTMRSLFVTVQDTDAEDAYDQSVMEYRRHKRKNTNISPRVPYTLAYDGWMCTFKRKRDITDFYFKGIHELDPNDRIKAICALTGIESDKIEYRKYESGRVHWLHLMDDGAKKPISIKDFICALKIQRAEGLNAVKKA